MNADCWLFYPVSSWARLLLAGIDGSAGKLERCRSAGMLTDLCVDVDVSCLGDLAAAVDLAATV